MIIESNFNPNKGTGSESDKITPYLGKRDFNINLLRPLEKLLLPTTS